MTYALSTPGAPVQPLARLVQGIAPDKLVAAATLLASLDRDRLLDRFRRSFHANNRRAALVIADALIERGVPPAFWHAPRSTVNYSLEQRADLLTYDVRWLRSAYPGHARVVRYERTRHMLSRVEAAHHRECLFAFYDGRRPLWKIVASLSLTNTQQHDCWLLRSAPVTNRHRVIQAMRDKVFATLPADLKGVRRTRTFTDDNARETLTRRHRLWLCAQMTDGNPTDIATRYRQLTGEVLSRQAVANQIAKVTAILRESEMTKHQEKEMT
ncbi:MAG: hypothetical protein H7274_17540 [Rhodoferax sp.]|nr:hypothetical protein [Rhodoferax sp.]